MRSYLVVVIRLQQIELRGKERQIINQFLTQLDVRFAEDRTERGGPSNRARNITARAVTGPAERV